MTSDPHMSYVFAAYGFGAAAIAAMVFAILRDYLSLKRALGRFPTRRDADDGERPTR